MEMYFKRMKDEWTGLVEQADPLIRAKAAEIAVAHAHYLSIEFYRIVRIDPHAEEFLSNEQVERQLKSAMERWIINVLSAQVDDVERLLQIQHTVAEVHARIGIPVEIVKMGFRVLKKILYPVIFSSDYSAAEKLQVYHFSINSIDIAMEVMTRAFTFSDSSASKEDENYRIFSLLENAEEEKERQIASILSWEIDIIYKILLDSDLGSSLPLSQADFGLWFNHKGRHYASENETLRTAERIRSRVEKTKLKAANGEDIALSLSIGAAMFNGHPDYERLIQIADEALYIAKRRGRNRVELWKASL